MTPPPSPRHCCNTLRPSRGVALLTLVAAQSLSAQTLHIDATVGQAITGFASNAQFALVAGLYSPIAPPTSTSTPEPTPEPVPTPTTPTTPAPVTVGTGQTSQVASGQTATLNGAGVVQASGGSRVLIPNGNAAQGATLQLPAGILGTSPGEVVIGNVSVQLQTQQATTLRITIVVINGLPTPVLQITSGQLILTTTTGAGQPLLALPGGGVLNANTSHVQLQITRNTGVMHLALMQGSVSTPSGTASARQAAKIMLGATVAGSNSAKMTVVMAGESASLDDQGQWLGHWLGSLNHDGGQPGDALALGQNAHLTVSAFVPRLNGTSPRLAQNLTLHQRLAQALTDAVGTTITTQTQNAWGSLHLNTPQGNIDVLPIGPVHIDATRPNGITAHASGGLEVVLDGIVVTLVPAIADLPQFAAQIAQLGGHLTLHTSGSLMASIGQTTWVLRPDWLQLISPEVTPTSFALNASGHLLYTDNQRRVQTLHPAFVDGVQLHTIVQQALPQVQLQTQTDGSVRIQDGTGTWVLSPDVALTPMFDGTLTHTQQGETWWLGTDHRLYFLIDGLVQGTQLRP